MKNQKPQTAAETYAKRIADAKNLLGSLSGWINEAEKATDNANWAQVGDLGRVVDGLWELVEFMGREDA